jgi:hypothetical protein
MIDNEFAERSRWTTNKKKEGKAFTDYFNFNSVKVNDCCKLQA